MIIEKLYMERGDSSFSYALFAQSWYILDGCVCPSAYLPLKLLNRFQWNMVWGGSITKIVRQINFDLYSSSIILDIKLKLIINFLMK
jgi:hypothetical protein